MWKKLLTLGGIVGAGGIIGFELFKTKPAKAATASAVVPLAPHPANSTGGAIPSSAFADFPKNAKVTTSSTALTIRKAADKTSAAVGSAAKGATIQITGPAELGDGSQASGWAPVKQGSTVGFASLDFLTVA